MEQTESVGSDSEASQPHTDALMVIAETSLKASSASLSGGERQQTRCAPSPQTDNPLIP